MSIGITTRKQKEVEIVQGSLRATIWQISWPLLVNMIAVSINNLVEIWVAGKLGADAQAAIGIGGQVLWFIMMLIVSLQIGTTALISRYFGARDLNNAVEAAKQALIFSSIFGIVTAFFGLLICRSLLHFLGASASVENQTWQYLRFAIVSLIPWALFWTTQSIFRAKGDTRTAMNTIVATMLLTVLLHVGLCLYPLHIGVSGLGLAWIIGSSVGFVWNVIQLRNSEMAGCLRVVDSLRGGISKEWFMRFMKIGLPGCIQDIALLTGSFGIFHILCYTHQPIISQAAWSLGWRVEEALVLNLMAALNMSIAIIIGQNLGAHKSKRAEQAGWNIAYAGIAINIFAGGLLWLFASNVAKILSSDPLVIKVATEYFHLISWTEPFLATWFILSGGMQGAGYTRIPMMITIFCFALVRLPLAWYLTVVLGIGANGAWIAMATTSALAGILMAIEFKRGRWKEQTV